MSIISDQQRDARIAECMGFLNALFYAYCHPEVSSADPRTDMWAWATNLRDAIQPSDTDVREQSILGRCEAYARRAEQAQEQTQSMRDETIRLKYAVEKLYESKKHR